MLAVNQVNVDVKLRLLTKGQAYLTKCSAASLQTETRGAVRDACQAGITAKTANPPRDGRAPVNHFIETNAALEWEPGQLFP
jgi:hypothetical protein